MNEKQIIDRIVLNYGLFHEYGRKENEIGFYQNLESLRVLNGLASLDAAIDYADRYLKS